MAAIGKWLAYPTPFAQNESFWADWVTRLRIQDGVSLLEIGPGKSSLSMVLGGGVYYTQVTEDAELARLSKLVYADGQFLAASSQELTKGDPNRQVSVAVLHVSQGASEVATGPCHETCLRPTQDHINLQVAAKSLVDHGYLLVLGNLEQPAVDWLSKQVEHVWTGEGVNLYQRPTGKPKQKAPAEGDVVLSPAPVVSSDPRPWLIHPWSIRMTGVGSASKTTQVIRRGTAALPEFGDPGVLQAWAWARLAEARDPQWHKVLAEHKTKCELVNYLRLRQEGSTPLDIFGVEIPESVSLQKYLRKRAVKISRSLLTYPRNLDPARTYWSLGVGDVITDGTDRYKVVVVEPYPDRPPRVTLEKLDVV
jgi:hypothetical protein